MAKKVLISLGELVSLRQKFCECSSCMYNNETWGHMMDWFNSQPEAPQWISVEDDKKPIKGCTIMTCVHHNVNLVTSIEYSGYFNPSVTHWMPIPELPEKEND